MVKITKTPDVHGTFSFKAECTECGMVYWNIARHVRGYLFGVPAPIPFIESGGHLVKYCNECGKDAHVQNIEVLAS